MNRSDQIALLAEQPELKELQLQGAGEPFAHPRFFDMIAYAVSRGVDVVTSSNLLAISDARIEQPARRVEAPPRAAQCPAPRPREEESSS